MIDDPVYARQVPAAQAKALSTAAERARPAFRNAPVNQQQEQRRDKMRGNKVLVRGRFTSDGREVWDVVKLIGGRAELYAKGCAFREEALELACQCLSGRTFVSIGSARALVSAGSGGMMSPYRGVHPGHGAVTLVPQDGRKPADARVIEVRPGLPPPQKLILA